MKRLARAAAAALTLLATLPSAALAGTAGGGMPYENGLQILLNSIQGPVAGVLIVIGVVGGIGMWIAGGQLEGMLQTIARVIIGACIVGGVTGFLATIGVVGAVL
jgi:type IV secretory pathway VirB2 component (pilin)